MSLLVRSSGIGVEQVGEFILPETEPTVVEIAPSFGEKHLELKTLHFP